MKSIKLYYHKTDGGAEYLCSKNYINTWIKGGKEGNLKSKYVIRIDGDITKNAELTIR